MNTGEETKLRVFLCHASEDKSDVRELYDKLSAESWIEPWLDERNILPGQEWDTEIEKAVENADVVIVFLSNLSITKEGYVQRELKYILGIALEKPEGTIFIIPLRLDNCKPPRRVRTWQYVDYFPEDQRDVTYQHLLQSLRVRLEQRLETEEKKTITKQDRVEQIELNANENKLNILFLAADPTDASRLRLGQEAREIREKLQLSKHRDRFIFNERWSVRPVDISQAMLDLQPQIVHFSGHGTTNGAICFENQTGKMQPVTPEALSSLFEQFTNQVRAVVLNACYSEQQAKAISKQVDYVIGMNKGITDMTSIAFSIGFYQAIGSGRSIPDAYSLGVTQIRLQGYSEFDIPVLLKKEAKKSPDPVPEPPPPKPQKPTIIPTGAKVSLQDWIGSPLPPAYVFVGEIGTPPNSHFFRHRDGHLSVLVSGATAFGEDFLIDKYAITCWQFSNFLNDLCDKGVVQTTTRNGEYQAVAEKHTLVVDASDRWKKTSPSQPWLHAPKPFGVTYQSGKWAPVPESNLLPVILVTWWGARLYSLWAHDEIDDTLPDAYACLPTPEQWQAAATWDPHTHVPRPYPWGDKWNPLIVNFSGYWSGRNITEEDWQSQWAANSLAHSSTRPLPVAALEQNSSPAGCVQMLGNTWEWTLSALESRLPIQGGCATSPMEHCQVGGNTRWSVDMPNEYIGFRCSYSLRRSA